MPEPVATNIIVFGRGLAIDEAGIRLSQASVLRVQAAANYVRENSAAFESERGRIVFSGGWPGAAERMPPPAAEYREAALMIQHSTELAIAGGDLSLYADVYAEDESDSTLENVLRTKENGYFGELSFTAGRPLGLVAHAGHMRRIDYLTRKVFALPPEAIRHIVAPGPDNLSGGISERTMLRLTRLLCIGARGHEALRRRQRLLASGRALTRSSRTATAKTR